MKPLLDVCAVLLLRALLSLCCSVAVESAGEVISNDDSVVSGDTTADSVRVHVRSVSCFHNT